MLKMMKNSYWVFLVKPFVNTTFAIDLFDYVVVSHEILAPLKSDIAVQTDALLAIYILKIEGSKLGLILSAYVEL